jgi:toxin-antitoxin system PIN domain toxin
MKKASSNLLLLDVNVLLALAWPNHQFHEAATRALEARGDRWATCALTQLGFIRLSSNPAAIAGAKSPVEAANLLAAMTGDPQHVYLEPLPPPTAAECLSAFESALGTRQVTDAYLLWLARRNNATFVTFDRKLAHLGGSRTKIKVLGV